MMRATSITRIMTSLLMMCINSKFALNGAAAAEFITMMIRPFAAFAVDAFQAQTNLTSNKDCSSQSFPPST